MPNLNTVDLATAWLGGSEGGGQTQKMLQDRKQSDEYLMCNVFVSVSGRIYAQGQQHDPVLLWKLDRDDAVVQRR